MNDFIPLLEVNLTDDDIQQAVNVLKTGMLVQGTNVLELEKSFCEYLDVKHAIAASNGTASLHMALVALGIGVGDEVVIPALSYIATANVVELVGATPIFVDIDINTFCIDEGQIEDKITERTKAIIPVHEFGLMSNMPEIMNIAHKYQLYVIEDAACALGAIYNGKHAGTYGDIGSFSLHPRKAITSGEGGVLTTNSDELASKLRALRNHGAGVINGKAGFILPGFNYRLTDFQAALVNSQFKRLNSIIEIKTKLAEAYNERLKECSKLRLPSVPQNCQHSWQTYHIVIQDEVLDRDDLIAELKYQGIGTNYGAQCMPYEHYYLEKYKLDCHKLFPNAMVAFQKGLALPLFEKLSVDELKRVIKILINLLRYENE